MRTGRVPGMTGQWPRKRRTSMVVVETPYACERCGEVYVHHELMPEWDEPYGLDGEEVLCECGGVLRPVESADCRW